MHEVRESTRDLRQIEWPAPDSGSVSGLPAVRPERGVRVGQRARGRHLITDSALKDRRALRLS